MSIDQFGLRRARGGLAKLLEDRRGIGLLYQRLRVTGTGTDSSLVPIRTAIPARALEEFSAWTDLPPRTAIPATLGGTWVWNGTSWKPENSFWLYLGQGAVASPLAAVGPGGWVSGFNAFAPALTLPAAFWAPGRRLRMTGDIISPSASSNSHTYLQIGGVTVIDAQWQGTTVAQHFEIDLWVSGATQITTSAIIVYDVASPPESIVETSADYTVAGLNTTPTGIQLGINDARVTPSGTFKLTHFTIQVTA